jgi:hypothetical protein
MIARNSKLPRHSANAGHERFWRQAKPQFFY